MYNLSMKMVEYDRLSWESRAPVEMICAVYNHKSQKPTEFSGLMKKVAEGSGLGLKTVGLTSEDWRSLQFLEWKLRELSVIYWAAGGKIKGERIVDLGCGSTGRTYEHKKYSPGTSAPKLARTLSYLGADVVGVDYGDFGDEPFEAHSGIDLLTPGCLDFLPDRSVNIFHSSLLYTSPQLSLMVTGRESPLGSIAAGNVLAANLLPQIEKKLIKNGYYVYHEAMNTVSGTNSDNPRIDILDQYGVQTPLEDIICGMDSEEWFAKKIPCFCP